MNNIVFALVVLLFTVPAWAQVTITATQVGTTPEVEISYVSDGNLPRAFGLDITVTDGNIVACTAAMEGECTATVRGFGIFPGTIDIDDTVTPPVVNSYGTPVAPGTARGALGGLGTPGITIEMGSLYEGPNAPPSSGVLVTIEVSTGCTVNIAGNAARCGEGSAPMGVVMEDPGQLPPVIYVSVIVPDWDIDCMSSDHPSYDQWVAVLKPGCWCRENHPDANPRQCHGDADGTSQGKQNFWVSTNDLDILVAAWSKPFEQLTGNQICADFDHASQGKQYFRVSTDDLDILVAGWSQANLPLADCP